jgi:hypothetical protein
MKKKYLDKLLSIYVDSRKVPLMRVEKMWNVMLKRLWRSGCGRTVNTMELLYQWDWLLRPS